MKNLLPMLIVVACFKGLCFVDNVLVIPIEPTLDQKMHILKLIYQARVKKIKEKEKNKWRPSDWLPKMPKKPTK